MEIIRRVIFIFFNDYPQSYHQYFRLILTGKPLFFSFQSKIIKKYLAITIKMITFVAHLYNSSTHEDIRVQQVFPR